MLFQKILAFKVNIIEIRNLEHTEVFQTDVKQLDIFHKEGHAEGMTHRRIVMLHCTLFNGGSEEDTVKMLTASKEEIEAAGMGMD